MECAYKNKEDQAASSRRYYARNRTKVIAAASEARRRLRKSNRLLVGRHLSKNHCVDCGERDPIVLEFDHVRGVKKDNISNMVGKGVSTEIIVAEIAKCEVRCANCHRRATAMRRMAA